MKTDLLNNPTPAQQRQFVSSLTKSVCKSFAKLSKEGKIPDDWNHHDLRQWLADAFHNEVFPHVMKGPRLRHHRKQAAAII